MLDVVCDEALPGGGGHLLVRRLMAVYLVKGTRAVMLSQHPVFFCRDNYRSCLFHMVR